MNRHIPIKYYKGSIIEESLEDNMILNSYRILKMNITDDNDPADRWHIFSVEVTRIQIEELSKAIKPQKYYAHFWDEEKNMIVVFRDKIFEFSFYDKDSWQSAIDYGISVGVRKEDLNFHVE